MAIGIVTGFGRCGTTLVMNMLHAGGIPMVGRPPAFEPSQLGLVEFNLRWVEAQQGRVIKYIDPSAVRLPEKHYGPVVWLDRDPRQQAASQIKFMNMLSGLNLGRNERRKIEASLKRDRPRSIEIVRQFGPVTMMTFEGILRDPDKAANLLASAFGELGDLDVDKARAVVLDRNSRCAPGLEVETALIKAAS